MTLDLFLQEISDMLHDHFDLNSLYTSDSYAHVTFLPLGDGKRAKTLDCFWHVYETTETLRSPFPLPLLTVRSLVLPQRVVPFDYVTYPPLTVRAMDPVVRKHALELCAFYRENTGRSTHFREEYRVGPLATIEKNTTLFL